MGLDGTFPREVFATFITTHFSWMNVDYPFIGPWTLSRLDPNKRNNDCLFKASKLSQCIFRTAWANRAYGDVNKPNVDLNTEVPDGTGPEMKSGALGNSEYGHTTPADFKEHVHLNEKLWEKCDEKKPESIFMMTATLLHESAHWKHDVKKYDNTFTAEGDVGGEAGLRIENRLFGGDRSIWTSNGGLPIGDGLVVRSNGVDQTITSTQLGKLADCQWWKDNDANFGEGFWNTFWASSASRGSTAVNAAVPGASPLRITLSLDQSIFDVGAPIPVTLLYENVSSAPIRVLALTVLEGYPLFFEIRAPDTSLVPFIGPKAKYGVAPQDFVDLPPGGLLQVTVDLTRDSGRGIRHYNFTRSGTYEAKAIYGAYFGLPQTESNAITFVLNAGGRISGQVSDARTGQPLVGATLRALQGEVVVASAVSVGDGTYAIPELPAGTYTVEARAAGFLRSRRENVTVASGELVVVNFSLPPLLVAGEMSLVLTWGTSPRDLDSHLWLPLEKPYHVAYFRRGTLEACPFAELDLDDTTSLGPETVTIKQRFAGSYLYAVHQFSGDGTLATSEAQVQLFDSSGLVTTINVPTAGTGRWWKVLSIDGATGAISEINEIGADPAPFPDTSAGCESPASASGIQRATK